ncbi:HAD-IIA family hydrolase [Candidatus Micrarchaeota archaeon]|nr:HAD-IIA family hydrolase [Candidatus Micrarchaeota archaeon]
MLKAVLFDLDGTIYKGETAIAGADDALGKLRKRGIRVFFISNAATESRAGVVKKLARMGVRSSEKEVYNATYATAKCIKENFRGKRVFCFGEKGMKEEFAKHGIKIVDDERAEVVVVGLDRTIDYDKIAVSCNAIRNGAVFIATNEDALFPVEDGYLPGAGAMVAAVERCTRVKPFVIGKPGPYFAELIIRENKLGKKEMLIVGDMLETDVKFAKNTGIKSVLVLTGMTKRKDLKNAAERPDYVLHSIAQLPSLVEKLSRP